MTFILTSVFGQDLTNNRLLPFLDSLKTQLLADTIKFKQTDLVFTATGRRNAKPYSPLFIINGAYIYKLDIVNGSQVVSFVNEILDAKKIKSINYIDSTKASEHFGQNAWQGVILITMLDKVKFNPKVGGLTIVKNKSGDNFTVRKKDEILLHD